MWFHRRPLRLVIKISDFPALDRKTKFLPREYLSSGVNVLTNGLKISDITKKDFFQLKFSLSIKKLGFSV